MDVSDLRIALFSGNYNMTVDGANKALNRLVGYLLAHGAAVRVYSPTVANPDFEPTGDLVSVPSFAISPTSPASLISNPASNWSTPTCCGACRPSTWNI